AEQEEKRRQEEQEKKEQEEKQKMLTENVTSERVIEAKGKAVESEHDPPVLILQEQLAT
ncbi:hypothetical protein A2U01_0113036, partial [Trifolium medium]|nr:hypothetical protein [Trifolium medium]